ncbi:uncharacterized protein B0I36DRAFT_362738 [Microdochium trichocladiopsis]|uniref:Uncharacterized protein n=1 Tax=Microdochium trichocladiopsis TaxID=1682393 RepID=A0A9P9BQI0_9PEZI|nr:uncharacterized protein B0I36DRAFT_362738 [Microdochium trichocladiopsis]KAH7030947.1 hypothetical protein B0I36DRAFT_362738 [Microdochium trichocladiopsis]
MGGQQPYMYDAEKRNSSRFPQSDFDPKAFTRASWQPKPQKPKHEGPLVSFNRHPDLHEVPRSRITSYRPMSDTSKWLIKWTRYLQIVLRSLELIAGLGLMVLMILLTKVELMTSWVMRITPGVAAVCSAYAIWHHGRPARARPPASSAAYQLFSGITDCAVLPLYAYGMLAVNNHSAEWDTLLADKTYLRYFILSEYWTLLGAGALHVVSLLISVYLGLMFKRIANMPPDMNPLESNLTSRMHKRNKSSVTTVSTASDSVHRLSTPLEGHRRSGAPYETLSRPPSMPFMHTRQNSGDSFVSSKRDSRSDLPSRQYQIPAANMSRASVATFTTAKTTPPSRGSAHRGTYAEISLDETGTPRGRPKSMVTAKPLPEQPINASPTRVAKFTESWYATDSMVNRTQQRQRAMNAAEREQERQQNHRNQAYESLTQRYDNVLGDSDDENLSDRDHDMMRPDPMDDVSDYEDDNEHYRGAGGSPINASARMSLHDPVHPLRSHPSGVSPKIINPTTTAFVPTTTTTITSTPTKTPPRQKTPFRALRDSFGSALSEVSLNSRRVSGGPTAGSGGDIADAKSYSALSIGKRYSQKFTGNGKDKSITGNRNSSIQADHDFFSAAKPYGELQPGTPPVMLSVDKNGSNSASRQVSSGNDYDLGGSGARASRRHVSGKAAEEGMAGTGGKVPYSRYSVFRG